MKQMIIITDDLVDGRQEKKRLYAALGKSYG